MSCLITSPQYFFSLPFPFLKLSNIESLTTHHLSIQPSLLDMPESSQSRFPHFAFHRSHFHLDSDVLISNFISSQYILTSITTSIFFQLPKHVNTLPHAIQPVKLPFYRFYLYVSTLLFHHTSFQRKSSICPSHTNAVCYIIDHRNLHYLKLKIPNI